MKDNNIGICILNFNSSNDLERLLKEFVRDNIKFPIVVVDNSNNEKEILLVKQLIKNFFGILNIVYILSKKNLGYFKGNFIGVSYLKQHFKINKVLILNPDVSSQNWCNLVENLLLFLKNDNDFLVGPKIINSSRYPSTPLLYMAPFVNVIYNIAYPFSYFVYKEIQRKKALGSSKKVFAIEGSVMLVNSNKFIEIYKYFKNVFLYEEERIMGLLAKKYHWNIYYVPFIEVLHYHKPLEKNINNIPYFIKSNLEIIRLFYKDSFWRESLILTLRYRYFIKKTIVRMLNGVNYLGNIFWSFFEKIMKKN
ncbi:hypothetical protein XJ44_04140 [Thermosipho affectus]|uniref:Glycosyltransferase n=1 Tax=Thermosipho affectus TaxID=660294 RepID=A0ABX3IIX7_9BACT|nr:glycosyltransferase family 2 protein [Thermosipho affectus]ONN27385.1 hypothetical protein XJ44_04140 [Thermosipho affectus]